MPKSSLPFAKLGRWKRQRIVNALRREANEQVQENPAGRERMDRPPAAIEINNQMDDSGESSSDEEVQIEVEEVANDINDRGQALHVNNAQDPDVNDHVENTSDESNVSDDHNSEEDEDENSDEEEVNTDDDDDGNVYDDEGNDDYNDSDDNEENDIFANFGNRELYAGAPLTVSDSVCVLLTFILKHNLNGSCIEDLLRVIQLHCPQEGFVKLSLYKLKKYFSFAPGQVKNHYYCSVCSQSLETSDEICQLCHRRQPVSYFIQTPLRPQIREIFSRTGFFDSLQHRFVRRRLNADWIEDIYDGALYKEQVEQGFLSNPNHFSMSYCTDGVPVFKSKTYEFWPFYLTINELPYKQRIKKENTMLAGLWFGPCKPHGNLFMSSFIDDFHALFNGVNVQAAGQEEQVRVRGILLSGVADTPARSLVLNCKQHNGFHGCFACETPGETVQLPNGNDTHAYRYVERPQKRTVERMLEQARLAVDANEPQVGVKGPTILRLFMPDFIRGTGIDTMHLVMGISRKLLNLHFNSQLRNEPYSLRAVMAVVDHMLISIKPPRFVHRLPRSVEDWCHWKASEFKAWFFYYSVAIYEEVMQPLFFNHYIKLVTAVSYLSASSISIVMIHKADQLLNEFVRDFQNLYGLHNCSINIHVLLHLAGCVKELRPLWAYSCFPYENMNGEILRVIHGKTNVDSQVSRMHWQWLSLPNKMQFLRDGPVKEYCSNQRKPLKIGERLFQLCYTIGTYSTRDVNNNLITQALQHSQIRFTHLKTYTRLLKSSLVYVAENYNRDLKSSSSYIAYNRQNSVSYGTIYTFVKVLQCDCDVDCNCRGEHFAIVRGIEKVSDINVTHHPNTNLKYMHQCRLNLSVRAVPIIDLKTVCFFMAMNNKLYIAEPVNQAELE